MNLIEELGLVVGDQVQYTGAVDTTIYTVKRFIKTLLWRVVVHLIF